MSTLPESLITVPFRLTRLVIVIEGSAGRVLDHLSSGGLSSARVDVANFWMVFGGYRGPFGGSDGSDVVIRPIAAVVDSNFFVIEKPSPGMSDWYSTIR